ncbi:uncharacterized protein LOC141600534 [Silene latifolia]|uniref:uncharacterized protein LOC141600534 n=1 Tax=Silene latifolia TaxID=37657 RepID=UPI003D77A379
MIIMRSSINLQSCSLYAPNSYNNNNNINRKLSVTPTEFQIPNTLSFAHSKPISSRSKFQCCSSSSRRFTVGENLNDSLYDSFKSIWHPQVISVLVVLRDEDRRLKQKLDELANKRNNESDVTKQLKIVMNEFMPQLLENADLWISSHLMVSSNPKEALLKLFKLFQIRYQEVLRDDNKDDASNYIHYTEVIVDIQIAGTIADKLKGIHTRDDFKLLLHDLMSLEFVTNASPLCSSLLVLKEKTKELEDYSHSTF